MADLATIEVVCPCGSAAGVIEGGTRVFKALPFATAGRWQPPTQLVDWPPRNVDGTGEQLAAWQSKQPQPEEVHQTEDCLKLTIRTPIGAESLPVMVWIQCVAIVIHAHSPHTARLDSLYCV
jgi:para-nitrobenzyl esterase